MCFSCCVYVILSCFFACLVNFTWKLNILNDIMGELWKADFLPFPREFHVHSNGEVGSSREPPDRSNNGNFLGMKLWRSSSPVLPLVAACFWFSLQMQLLVFKASAELREQGMELGQVKMLQSSLFLLKFSFFSRIYIPPNCCKSANFQSLEKIDSDHFCPFSYCFYGEENFWRSLLCHFGWHHSPPLPFQVFIFMNLLLSS